MRKVNEILTSLENNVLTLELLGKFVAAYFEVPVEKEKATPRFYIELRDLVEYLSSTKECDECLQAELPREVCLAVEEIIRQARVEGGDDVIAIVDRLCLSTTFAPIVLPPVLRLDDRRLSMKMMMGYVKELYEKRTITDPVYKDAITSLRGLQWVLGNKQQLRLKRFDVKPKQFGMVCKVAIHGEKYTGAQLVADGFVLNKLTGIGYDQNVSSYMLINLLYSNFEGIADYILENFLLMVQSKKFPTFLGKIQAGHWCLEGSLRSALTWWDEASQGLDMSDIYALSGDGEKEIVLQTYHQVSHYFLCRGCEVDTARVARIIVARAVAENSNFKMTENEVGEYLESIMMTEPVEVYFEEYVTALQSWSKQQQNPVTSAAVDAMIHTCRDHLKTLTDSDDIAEMQRKFVQILKAVLQYAQEFGFPSFSYIQWLLKDYIDNTNKPVLQYAQKLGVSSDSAQWLLERPTDKVNDVCDSVNTCLQAIKILIVNQAFDGVTGFTLPIATKVINTIKQGFMRDGERDGKYFELAALMTEWFVCPALALRDRFWVVFYSIQDNTLNNEADIHSFRIAFKGVCVEMIFDAVVQELEEKAMFCKNTNDSLSHALLFVVQCAKSAWQGSQESRYSVIQALVQTKCLLMAGTVPLNKNKSLDMLYKHLVVSRKGRKLCGAFLIAAGILLAGAAVAATVLTHGLASPLTIHALKVSATAIKVGAGLVAGASLALGTGGAYSIYSGTSAYTHQRLQKVSEQLSLNENSMSSVAYKK